MAFFTCFFMGATPENAECFWGCRSPRRAAAQFTRSLPAVSGVAHAGPARPLLVAVVGIVVTAVPWLLGCVPAPRPVAVAEGEVTIDAEPVDGGIISFVAPETGTPIGGAAVIKGRYTVVPESGLAPGIYRVEIRWARSTGEMVETPTYGHSPYVFAEAIPGKFHEDSILVVELQAGRNTVNFHLEK
jgi:hypothetical protein